MHLQVHRLKYNYYAIVMEKQSHTQQLGQFRQKMTMNYDVRRDIENVIKKVQ